LYTKGLERWLSDAQERIEAKLSNKNGKRQTKTKTLETNPSRKDRDRNHVI
jgi:hypothetical protein